MEGPPPVREYLIDVESDIDTVSTGKPPTDDQFFLLYFIMGTYFGPDLKGGPPHKSVFQRRAEGLPPYTAAKLAGTSMKTVEVERIYYYVLRHADARSVLKLPCLHRFLHGDPSESRQTPPPLPRFDDLFPAHLHPHSHGAIGNIVFIHEPKTFYIGPEFLERFRRLTGLDDLRLDRDEARVHTAVDGKVLYNVEVQVANGDGGTVAVRGPAETETGTREGFGSEMIFLPSHPSKEEWINIVSATNNGCALSGSATVGEIGPILGRVDIGECDDSYLFRVSLPGVKRDEREFSCEVEDDGKVSIRGVTVTGEKTVCRFEQVFEMQSRKLCPPGHFSVSFKLPGPVDPQRFSGNFGTDGILEGVVMKARRNARKNTMK